MAERAFIRKLAEGAAELFGVGAPGSAAALGMDAPAAGAGRATYGGAVGAAGSEDARVPVRTDVPPVLLCALALWGSCAALYALAASWDGPVLLVVGAAGLLATAVAGCVLWRGGARPAVCLLLGCALGACCATGGAARLQGQMASVESAGWQEYAFELVEDAKAGAYGASALARTQLDAGSSCTVLLRFDGASEARFGDVVSARTALSLPGESQAQRCWQSGAAAVASVSDWEEEGRAGGIKGALLAVRNAAVDAILSQGDASRAQSVLAALVCGYRGDLSGSETYESFKVAGLAHLVAVSGAHFAVVSALALALLRACGLSARMAFCLQGLLMAGFLVVSAMPVSALRAALMACCGLCSFAARRRPASANALGVCIAALIAANPEVAVSVSFALSAASTLGIVLFSSLFGGWLGAWAPRLPKVVSDALAVTAATWVTSLPLSAALFSQVSLVSPLANVVASPLFGVVCAAGMVGSLAAAALPALAPCALAPGLLGSELLCLIAQGCALVPFASIAADVGIVPAVALSVLLAAALWRFWPQPGRAQAAAACVACVVLACALSFAMPRFAGTQIVMLDVGQGDAFLVRSQGAAVLIDTGNQDQLLREALARQGVLRLDAVVISHADDDHCGSLDALAAVVEVRAVCVAADALECPCESCALLRESAARVAGEGGVVGLEVGDSLSVGSFDLQVVWPREFADEGGNADSLTLLASADVDEDGAADLTALFCGDAEAEQLGAMLDAGLVGRVDLLKVGHHGSKAALSEQVAEALSPAVALVSAGEGNRYGHPAEATLKLLEDVGATVLRTDQAGDVSCKLTASGIRVSTLR